MHTILGAGGPISNALTRELSKTTETVRLISRREIATRGNTTWKKGDLLNFSEISSAVKGSSVIYLCAGLKYDKEIWRQQWPIIIKNVINAAKENNARLIFFDNVYMYGRVKGPMTETTPYNPSSVKGEIRAKIADTLMQEVKAGNLRASIARGADFYGATDSMNSFFDMMVLDKLSNNQTPQWIGNVNTLHSFTYVPDAAKGMYLLGQNPKSDNQIWHLPTAPAIKGKEFIRLAADIFNKHPKFTKINKLMLQLVGLFNPVVKGTVEMYYQYQYDYNFNSDKFEKAFGINPTSYHEGIHFLSQSFYNKRNAK
ncbi:NAD-dependent epimerase/dehydratase family protein [Rubrolithibacter danxiaensis]|uniref:NAD-dependent epimerase/dehydratase family protein n=1 Tax=Rubrolithibacter danxiaensis TaxID=3390805 RepID=UPI003BF8F3CD